MSGLLVENILAFCKGRFEAKGEVLPTFWATGPIQDLLLCTPWANEQEKQHLVSMIRICFQVFQIKEYFFACETWVRHCDGDKAMKEHLRAGKMVSEYNDKTEALHVWHVTKSSRSGHGFEIKRNPTELVPLPFQDYSKVTGRMVSLLPGDQPVPNFMERRFARNFVKKYGMPQ